MTQNEWIETRLGKHISLEYGKSLPETHRSGEGFPVFGSSGNIGAHRYSLVNSNGIILGRKGNVGSVFWSDAPFWVIDTAYYVTSSKEIYPRWLYWLLINLPLKSLDTSTGIPGLNRNNVYELPIILPPLAEQQRIAEILDTLDATISATEQLIAKLCNIKTGLLRDLLSYGLDAHGNIRDPQANPEQFKASLLGNIPREWEVTELGFIANVNRGKFTFRPRNAPHLYGGIYPFIQTGDISACEGNYLTSYTQTLSEQGVAVSREFPKDTIAVTIAANIADTAILDFPMFFPDSVVGVEVHKPHNVRFIELQIRKAKQSLDAQASQSAQKNINLSNLRPLPIAIPSIDEQHRIAKMYEQNMDRIRAEEAYCAKLKAMKQGLMEDLLTGTVRV